MKIEGQETLVGMVVAMSLDDKPASSRKDVSFYLAVLEPDRMGLSGSRLVDCRLAGDWVPRFIESASGPGRVRLMGSRSGKVVRVERFEFLDIDG